VNSTAARFPIEAWNEPGSSRFAYRSYSWYQFSPPPITVRTRVPSSTAARLWSDTMSSTAADGAATHATISGAPRSRSTRSSGATAARNGMNAISPPGVRAVVTPARSRPTASGSIRRVAIVRSTARNTPSTPTATHGSGRRPRL
jgi:hypothetical protein